MRHASTSPKGFTLIEISVAMLLAALLVGVAIPAVQSVNATQLKKSAGQMSGMAREAYARAAITGRPHRMVLDMDSQTFWLESTASWFVLSQEKAHQITDAEIAAKAEAKKASPFTVSKADLDERDRLKKQLEEPPSWSGVDDDLGHPIKLPGDCAFDRVWVAHQKEAFSRGQSYIHFWPSGRAESAIIRLTDDPEGLTRIISVKVNGLTGRTLILNRGLDIPTS